MSEKETDKTKGAAKGALSGRAKLRPGVIQEAMANVPGQAQSLKAQAPDAPTSAPAPAPTSEPPVDSTPAAVTSDASAAPASAPSPEPAAPESTPAASPTPAAPPKPTPAAAAPSKRGRPPKADKTEPGDEDTRSMVKLVPSRDIEIRQGLLHLRVSTGKKKYINQFVDEALEFYLEHLYKTGKLPRPA
jgi:hypothetical protein